MSLEQLVDTWGSINPFSFQSLPVREASKTTVTSRDMASDYAPPSRHKFMHTATMAVVIVVFYGIVFTTPMLRHIVVGVDTVQKLLVDKEPVAQDNEVAVSTSLPKDDYVAPMWSCKDTDRKKKLVFTHIFKTAGSSMRRLLSSYAETCNAGYVTVINCGAVTLNSIHSGNWAKGDEARSWKHGTGCKLKTTVYRNNTVVDQAGREGPVNTTFLENAQVDILSGHVSVGIDDNWKDEKGQHVDVQYLTFFRESTHKFVSAVLFLRPKLSFEEAVEQVKISAKRRLAKGEYLTDIANIMTPVQRAEFQKRNITLSPEQKVNLMIQNLKEKNILVGIVERMSESLEMLQHVIDKDGELDSMFEMFGKIPPGGANATKEIKANKSRLSSSEVLAEVEKDEEFLKVMREFVKYDAKVYQFALDMHMRQYKAFQQQNVNQIVESANAIQKTSSEVERVEGTAADSLSSSVKLDKQAKLPQTDSLVSTTKLVKEAAVNISAPSGDYNVDIGEPMWSCRDTDRKNKLAFVHIFKTAGSSMRSLLRQYGEKCSAGVAIVVNCAPVKPETINTGNWAKSFKYRSRHHGTLCKLKSTGYRNHTSVSNAGPGHDVPINTTYLKEANVDIVGGHITMGTDQYWKDEEGQHVDMQYLTFFRESTRKVVSAALYMNPNLSFDEAVEKVKERVRKNVAKGAYLDNSNYIITPAQTAKLRNVTLTYEDRANLMMQNLKENKVLVGIVEHMSESLEMLQYLVDKDGDLDDMFESFGMILPGANKTKEIAIKNPSTLSSSAVLAEVKKDEEFMKVMREYVKWDTNVYQFALDMHQRQYESFQQRKSNQITKSIEAAPQLPREVERVEEIQVDSSAVELNERAVFDVTAKMSDYSGEIEPMWSCQDSDRMKKLVFVHIFKTAGSSVRKLLRKYAKTCNAGLALAIRCAPVLPESIHTGNWIRDDEARTPCSLIQTTYRNNTIDARMRPMNTTVLEDSNVDILGGHITMGTEQDWKDDEGKHVDVQYLAFFRESMQKCVSSVLYLNPTLSFDQAVAKVKKNVSQNVKKGKYLDNSGYLLTPAQRIEYRNVTLTMEQTVDLVTMNLRDSNVLVGIVERMSESLEMLQRVMDKDGKLDSMFESFGKIPPAANKTKAIRANKSHLSSEEVLAEVEKDEDFMKVFREYIKWDDMIYRFALGMHMRQYDSFQQHSTVKH